MAFDPDVPSAATGHELASYIITQLNALIATSQVNADILTDLAAVDAVLDAVVASVGS